ncbi:MAG: NAD(P)-dependent alcohol dehydrogenase [Tannerella sp.]|jgi:NADPH:quinone reductase-like Zn-dependent oxidoreductase|nr:NAD(P)-dependent alcohol dehydrogenase [Tannerella sp.]
MKATICTKYGAPEVLKMAEVAKPTPKDNEVLIKIYAAGVTASDIFIRSSNVPLRLKIPMRIMVGIVKPRQPILGLVLAGKIEKIGKNIKRFKVGDEVCGLAGFKFGAYAEYVCLKETDSTAGALALKPKNLTFEEATVAAYGGLLAFQFLVEGHVQKGDKVLIYGASGTSGTLAIQILKHLGAEVTGVCSTANLEMVKKLGADHVLDYTKQDFLPEGTKYDFVLNTVGKYKTSKLENACKNALTPTGKYLTVDDGAMKLEAKRLEKIKEYVEAGHIKPVLDRCYPFDEIVEAHRYVEKGHKRGGVAIRIIENE